MTSRVLPPSEWAKLDGTELGPVWRTLNPETTRVIVVEDGAEVVGCWSLLPIVHAEGLWVAPAHRGKSAVLRRLWTALIAEATALDLPAVVTSSASQVVTDILVARGAQPVYASYVLPMDADIRAGDRAIGQRFHAQLNAQLPQHDAHPDDAAHDVAVGRAIRLGAQQPERAEAAYNQWAAAHGYAPVRLLSSGRLGGPVMVDIGEAVIAVTADGNVTVLEDRMPSCQS